VASYDPQYRLTVYAPRATDVTETTPLTPAAGAAHSDQFKVTTHPSLAGWKPYLVTVPGRRGRIDPLKKAVDIGEFSFTVLDQRQTPGGSNLVRWVTAFLGDVNGNPLWMGLKVFVEESLDNGATWSSFWTGAIQAARLVDKLRFELVTRDMAQNLRYKVFVGRPHVDAAGAVAGILPVGLMKSYGASRAVAPLSGTIVQSTTVAYQGLNYTIAAILLDSASRNRQDNVVTQNLFSLVSMAIVISPGGAAYIPFSTPDVHTSVRAIVKRLDTGAQGEFVLGYVNMSPHLRGGRLRYVADLTLVELRPPAGVATGTPLVNNGGGYGIGAKSIATDGWTISITGIVKKGDLVKFSSHSKHYTIQADANSNGSGQATLTIEPGLSAAIADNEALVVVGEPGFMKMPPNGQAVEFTIVPDAPISKNNPLLVNDVHPVQFWKDILDGHYSRVWRYEDAPPTGQSPGDPLRSFPYDAAKFAALIADTTFPKIRLLLTGEEELSAFVEQVICQPYQLGYYLDNDGKVVPVDLRMPSSLAGILTITDADLAIVPNNAQWEQTRESAIGRAKVKYYQDMPIAVADYLTSPNFGPSGAPIVENAMFSVVEHSINVLNLGAAQLSSNVEAIDARGARVMVGDAAIDGLSRVKWIEDKLYGFTRELRQPYGFGVIPATLICRRTANTAAKPGDLRLIDVDALPDPTSHLRGGTRLMRCIEPTEDGLTRTLRFIDLATNVVCNTPTLGAPTQQTGNTRHGAQTAVTLNAQGEPVEVRYAVTDTGVGSAPADTSPLWTFGDFVTVARNSTIGRQRAGQRIWFQGRSVAATGSAMKLPSAWVLASGGGFVDLAVIPPVTNVQAPLSLIAGASFRVTWTPGDTQLAVNILLASPTSDPRVIVARALPGSNYFDFPGDIAGLVLASTTTYRVGLQHVAMDGSVSTEVTIDVTTTSTVVTAPETGGIAILVGVI
jgi:hypothetical protein